VPRQTHGQGQAVSARPGVGEQATGARLAQGREARQERGNPHDVVDDLGVEVGVAAPTGGVVEEGVVGPRELPHEVSNEFPLLHGAGSESGVLFRHPANSRKRVQADGGGGAGG